MSLSETDKVDFLPGHPLSYTTTRIVVMRGSITLSTATGFIMKLGQKYALVTNWHVLSGYNPATEKCLSSMAAIPDAIEFHVTVSRALPPLEENAPMGEELFFKPVRLNLFQDGKPIWHDDRNSASQNDYAIIDLVDSIPELKDHDISLRSILGGRVTFRRGYQPSAQKGRFHIDDIQSLYPPIGSEIFILGYPRGVSSSGVFPIWKRGSMASEPQASLELDGVYYQNVFYIDALTKSGMSGAPVVYLARAGDHLLTEDGSTLKVKEDAPYILGVYAGRDGLTQEEYELAVGRVWKIGAIERLMIGSHRS